MNVGQTNKIMFGMERSEIDRRMEEHLTGSRRNVEEEDGKILPGG